MTGMAGPRRAALAKASLPLMRLEVDEKKSGDAYAIRAETLSDLIFVRGFSHGPERVLLIHFPRPSRRRYGLYSGG